MEPKTAEQIADDFYWKNLKAAGLPIVDIHELKEKTERITGAPKPIAKGDRVVAEVISRYGDPLDKIYNVPV